MKIETLRWKDGRLSVLDQTLLPLKEKWILLKDTRAVWEAIRSLRVRGAPLIGVVAAYGVVVAALRSSKSSRGACKRSVLSALDFLATSRPTAVNLFWALERMRRVAESNVGNVANAGDVIARPPKAAEAIPSHQLCAALESEARAIHEEDLAAGKKIGDHGAALLNGKSSLLTHCNAGALATSGYGTALAPVYRAAEKGRRLHVFVDETRPLLQGSRLTAWELTKAGIPMTLICDSMAATVFARGKVDAVIVGADRIAANGDTANKIGTYGVALLARAHGIPFYVAAPLSTIDRKIPGGKSIPIEERAAEEITEGFGKRTAPRHVPVFSPAFDVTPARFITAIVTERGVLRPPFARSIRRAFAR